MHPSDTIEADAQQGRRQTWRAVRWLITAAASLVLVTLFLTQGATTEAAAPAATATDTAVYHEMDTTCQQGFNCIANNCSSGNYYFCGYNLGATYPYNFNFAANYGCGFGGLNCGVNFAFPSVVNAPFFINPNNACNVGNFSCFNANVCNVGNFSCVNGNGINFNGCNFGNFSCLNANGVNFNGCNFGNFSCFNANTCAFGNFSCFGNPFFFNNGAVSTVATPATGVNRVTITSGTGQVVIYNPREIAQPAAQSAPVAAPAAPAANYATPLNAPASAPAAVVTSGGGDIHVLSAAPATKPAVTTDADDHRG